MKTGILVVVLMAAPWVLAGAQSAAPVSGERAVAFSAKAVEAQLTQLLPEAKAKGSSGATLEDFVSYKVQLSERTISGGAEVHAHWDDVIMVKRGKATLITGGTVVEGTTGADGETHGARIEGGERHALAAGDVVTVRAGTPHQMMLTPGTVFGAMVVKIHEP